MFRWPGGRFLDFSGILTATLKQGYKERVAHRIPEKPSMGLAGTGLAG